MGMHIVRSLDPDEPQRHKLLWIKDEIEHIVNEDMGTEAIRGIKLLYSDLHPAKISQSLRKMSKLCFLYVRRGGQGIYKFDEAGKYLPNGLQFLHWDGYPYRYLPKTFQADKLVGMEMPDSNIHQLWEGGEKKVLPKLRFLDLRYSKLETFDSTMTPNLEELVLQVCLKLVEVNISDEGLHLKKLDLSHSRALEKLTISNNKCRNLEKLDLRGCESFRELQMHGECPCLKYLDLDGTNLRSLNLGLTPNLEDLDLQHCANLEELLMPVECQKLTTLSLSATNKLVSSLNLGLTPNLEELRLLSENMNRLPDSISTLKHLRVLGLSFCESLEQLPEDLDRLECLEELYLLGCESLGNIRPDCICKMTRLKRLDLSFCTKLEKLPDEFGRLQSLEWLGVKDIAHRLKNLPESISQLKHLVVLDK